MKIEDGRTKFYQWDIGQRLIIEGYPPGIEVHFAMKSQNLFEAIRMDHCAALVTNAYSEGGKVYADIPNSLLQVAGDLYVYIYPTAGEEAHTEEKAVFAVTKREKPADYITTEEEILRWTNLEKDVRQNSEAIQANDTAIKEVSSSLAATNGEMQKNSAAIAQNDTQIKAIHTNLAASNAQIAKNSAAIAALGDISFTAPTFNLTEMGLSAIPFDGGSAMLETDTTELRAALDTGAVKFVFDVHYSGMTIYDIEQEVHAACANGAYISTITGNLLGAVMFVTIEVTQQGISAHGHTLKQFISDYINEALGGDY